MADDEQPRSRLAGTKRKASSALDNAGGDEASKRRHCEFLGLTFFTSALVGLFPLQTLFPGLLHPEGAPAPASTPTPTPASVPAAAPALAPGPQQGPSALPQDLGPFSPAQELLPLSTLPPAAVEAASPLGAPLSVTGASLLSAGKPLSREQLRRALQQRSPPQVAVTKAPADVRPSSDRGTARARQLLALAARQRATAAAAASLAQAQECSPRGAQRAADAPGPDSPASLPMSLQHACDADALRLVSSLLRDLQQEDSADRSMGAVGGRPAELAGTAVRAVASPGGKDEGDEAESHLRAGAALSASQAAGAAKEQAPARASRLLFAPEPAPVVPEPSPAGLGFPGFWSAAGDAAHTPAGSQGAAGPPAGAPAQHATPELLFLPPAGPAAASPAKPLRVVFSGCAAADRAKKVRFCDDTDEADGQGPAHAVATITGETEAAGAADAPQWQQGRRPGTPAKGSSAHPKQRGQAPRFGSPAFSRPGSGGGGQGWRQAALTFVADGSACVVLPPPPPGGAEGQGGLAPPQGADEALCIPRRLQHRQGLHSRLNLQTPPSPQGAQRSEQEVREAYLNLRLAQAWGAGERWARLDIAGLEQPTGQEVTQRARLVQLCAVAGGGADPACAALLRQLDREWGHLAWLRQRYTGGLAPGGAGAEAGQQGASDEAQCPVPRSILKHGRPVRPASPSPAASPAAAEPVAAGRLPAAQPAASPAPPEAPIATAEDVLAARIVPSPQRGAPLASAAAGLPAGALPDPPAGAEPPAPPSALCGAGPEPSPGSSGGPAGAEPAAQPAAAVAPSTEPGGVLGAVGDGPAGSSPAALESGAAQWEEQQPTPEPRPVQLTPGPSLSRGRQMLRCTGTPLPGANLGGALAAAGTSPLPPRALRPQGLVMMGGAQRASRGKRLLEAVASAVAGFPAAAAAAVHRQPAPCGVEETAAAAAATLVVEEVGGGEGQAAGGC